MINTIVKEKEERRDSGKDNVCEKERVRDKKKHNQLWKSYCNENGNIESA